MSRHWLLTQVTVDCVYGEAYIYNKKLDVVKIADRTAYDALTSSH